MKLTLQQLEAHLWGAANILRGKTAGQDYKNYILSLMFYKRLCDQWEGLEIRVDDGNARQYRKLVIQAGKVCGAILVGHPDLFDLVAEGVKMNLDVSLSLPALAQGDWSVLSRSLPGRS